METLRFDYKPKAWVMALSGLFFAGCAAIMVKTASENDRGLILNGLIELDTGEATTFYWAIVAVSALFVAVALYAVARSFGAPQEVVLDRRTLSAPKSGTGRTVITVPLTTITDLQIQQVKSQKFLIVRHTAGKLTIVRSMLPSHADFDTLVAAIDQRCRAMRGR